MKKCILSFHIFLLFALPCLVCADDWSPWAQLDDGALNGIEFSHRSDCPVSAKDPACTLRWRFLSNSNYLESSGTGEVKDTSKKLIPGLVSVSHFDDNVYVRAGELLIPWSYANKTSAWLYYTKERTEVVLLPDTKFETEDLSNQPKQ